MHQCKMYDEVRMVAKPFSNFFTMMRTDMVAAEMNRTDVGINFYVQRFQ